LIIDANRTWPAALGAGWGRLVVAFVVALLSFATFGCQSAVDGVYYSVMEGVGREKRHILRDRVESGQEDQREAQEQFQSAYESFKQVSGYDGGDLEALYQRLDDEYQRSEARAQDVRDRIDSIERVATDLFDEWAEEIGQIHDPSLRNSSAQRLAETKRDYATLIAAMKRAAAKMTPVLTAFHDQVLYLKHNLNARAISSLDQNVREIEGDVAALIREIGASIAEAESFLASMDR